MKVYLTLLIVAALMTYVATPAMRHLAIRLGAVTAVRARDVHSVPTARLGGVAIFLGLAAGLLVARAARLTGRFDPQRHQSALPSGAGASVAA